MNRLLDDAAFFGAPAPAIPTPPRRPQAAQLVDDDAFFGTAPTPPRAPAREEPAPAPLAPLAPAPVAAGPEPTPAPARSRLETIGANLLEVPKGVIPGAIGMAGATLQGVAGQQKALQSSAAGFGREQIAVMDRIDRGETVPEMEDALGYQHMTPEQRAAARAQAVEAAAAFNPGRVEDSALFSAGEAVTDFGRNLIPAAPGMEDSLGRVVGEGLGSVVAGGVTSWFGGPVAAGAAFSMAGAGEAVDRAVRAGASEDQIIQAAKLGVLPGLTDSVPVEVLLGRIPIPGVGRIRVPDNAIGTALRIVGRIGMQAFVEAIQEGSQETIQNLIAREVYAPDQSLIEGVAEGAGIGAIVGGLTEALVSPFRRRGAQSPQTFGDAPDGVPVGAMPADEVLGPDPEAERAIQLQQARDALERELLGDRAGSAAPAAAAPPSNVPATLEEWLADPRTADQIREEAVAQREQQTSMMEALRQTVAEAEAEAARRGTRAAPIKVEDPSAVHENAQITATPTPAQAEAGNYRKRHVSWQGLDIAIETEMGQERTGIDPTGAPWSVTMPAPYGYIKRTTGRDGDQVDVYLGPNNVPGVYVVDQIDPATGKFDEHKVMLGFGTEDLARQTYAAAFSDASGEARLGAITPMTVQQFKQWVRNGNTKKPVAYKPARSQVRAQRTPTSLFDFIASRGGLAPNGELSFLGLDAAFVPGYGRLIRSTGMDLDRAREAAAEAGYFGAGADDVGRTTVRDLLDLLDTEARRGRGATELDGGAARAERTEAERMSDPAYQDHMRNQARLSILEHLDIDEADAGRLHPETLARATEYVLRGDDVEAAVIQAEFEVIYIDADLAPKVAAAVDEPIPGWDDADFDQLEERRSRGAPRGEQGARPEAEEGAAPARIYPGADGAGAREARAPDVEFGAPGAERDPQQLIEGVAPITPGQRLAAQVDRPMAPRAEQRAPGGLFGPERDQTDIFDAPAAAPAPAKTSAPTWDTRNPIGLNARGNPVYEDERGVRSYSERGIRISESVGIVPGRGISVDASRRGSDFLIEDEWRQAEPARETSRSEAEGGLATESENRPDPSTADVGTPERPNVQALARAFGEHFASPDGAFKTILQARQFAAGLLGGPVKPGTEAAKSVDEAVELGAVLAAREIVTASRAQNRSDGMIFDRLSSLAERMPNLNVRTSTSVANQAYSTPLPLAFVASRLAGITPDSVVFEPSAGNGALLIEAAPENAIANEIDESRRASLKAQGFRVTGNDASAPDQARVLRQEGRVDVVIGNPPFGPITEGGRKKTFKVDELTTNEIDHAIVMQSLKALTDDGSAVLIIGGVDKMKKGEARSDAYNGKAKRNFFYSLYQGYNVVEHVTVSGDLYAKQGAAWPVDVIVIKGRGKSSRRLPAADVPRVLESWADVKGLLDGQHDAGAARPADVPARGPVGEGDDRGARADDAGRARGVGVVASDSGGSRLADQDGRSAGLRARPDRGQSDAARAPELQADARGPAGDAGAQRASARAGAGVDLDALFDDALDDVFGAQERAPTTTPSQQPPARTASQAATSAVANTAGGLRDVAAGLNALFDPRGRLGSGPTFDAETYAKAKPLFIAGVRQLGAAGRDIADVMRALVRSLADQGLTRAAVENMRPYLVRFVADVQSGAVSLEDAPAAPPARAKRPRAPEKQADPSLFATEAQAETAAVIDAEPAPKPKPRRAEQKIDTSGAQAAYRPRSDAKPMQTLVPVNMQTAVGDALADLEKRVGDIDSYVARELGMTRKELDESFGAEQVDGIALAIDNFSRGAGFILGDQTGIGKGRQVAAVLRWSIRNGKTPIFVTEKPTLYADMYRDLVDVAVPKMLGRDIKMLMTNAGESVPLTDDGSKVLKSQGAGPHNALLARLTKAGKLDDYDIVFTTYSQMQTVKGKATGRMDFLRAMAAADGVIVMDESHNAGGQKATDRSGGDAEPELNRATFARELTHVASAVLYSSATYAKRPDVMDLYAKTDMRLAVDDINKLGELIARGGVPMQQIVATMLAKAGQYVRRERSFDGIRYDTPTVPVDRRAYENFSGSIKLIQSFSEDHAADAVKALSKRLKDEAKALSFDGSVGSAGASSTNFTSVMHNVIDQMLLTLTVDRAADRAIAALKDGRKPVITVASTLESFLREYAEEVGIAPGDAIAASANDLLLRYLERSRMVTVKGPNAGKGEGERIRLSDADLGAAGVKAFKRAEAFIRASGLDTLPISPIDWIRHRLIQAGYSVGEITGRDMIVDYGSGAPTLSQRDPFERTIRGKRKAIADFNAGALDVMILNQSGSTGLSLHASERVADKKPRRMIIAQAEGNIDTHMQMLGRVNRTGQVVLPDYEQLVADVPATKRPAAVLAKKMASLNANTTGARSSAVTAKDVPDFMNVYGDRVAAQVMSDNPDIHEALGEPLKYADGGLDPDEAMRKVTGRIPLLPLAQQEALYETLEGEYAALLQQMEATGQNALEAKMLELDAVTLDVQIARAATGVSPFAEDVSFETLDVKMLGKPMSSAEVIEKLRGALESQADTLPKLAREGAQRVKQIREGAWRDWIGYKREALDDLESDKLKAQEMRLGAIAMRWTGIIETVAPGRGVKLMTSEGNFYGVVLDVKRSGSTKNPLALGAWKATIALADPARQITIPFSQLYTARGRPDNIPESWIEIEERDRIGSMPILEAFDDMQAERREKRVMVTGNLLAGYEVVNGRGTITNFVDREGRLRQGILMPRDFDLAKFNATAPIRINLPDQIVQFLERTKGFISATDGLVQAKLLETGDIRFEVDPGRGRGGRYFLDKGVLAAAGKDFVKTAGMMRLDVPPPRARRVFDALRALGSVFETKVHRDVAMKITGDTGVALARRQEPAIAPSAREPSSEVFSRGGVTVQFLLRERFSASVDRLEGQLRARLDALGLADVGVRLVDKIRFMIDGQGFAADGAYMGRLISVALDGPQDPRAVMDHEAIHALRRLGFFTDQEWTLLERRAASGWVERYRIADAYADVPAAVQLEEGVAHAFSDWRAGKLNASGIVARLFRRIRAFFEALRNALDGLGFRTAEDVFAAVDRGEVGARAVRGEMRVDAAAAAMRASPFYSAIERAVQGLRQAKATGQQWLAMITKAGGVKAEEVDWLGLPQWLGDRPGVTRDELLDYIQANKVRVEEVVMSDDRVVYPGQTLDNGQNYRELLITLPRANFERPLANGQVPFSQPFQSSHWTSENVVAHIRFNERSIARPPDLKDRAIMERREALLPEIRKLNREMMDAVQERHYETRRAIRDHEEAVRQRVMRREISAGDARREIEAFEPPSDTKWSRRISELRDQIASLNVPDEPSSTRERVLFIEEIQSDWHQIGRAKGYRTGEIDTTGWTATKQDGEWVVRDAQGRQVAYPGGPFATAAEVIKIAKLYREEAMVPDAPLKKTWHETAFRRAVAWAAENGFERVAWTTGETQGDRYDQITNVETVTFTRWPTGGEKAVDEGAGLLIGVAANGETALRRNVASEDLADIVGKDVADRLMAQKPRDDPDGFGGLVRSLGGLSIPIGGEGMKGFYDGIIPAYAAKWGKRFGARVEKTQIETSPATVRNEASTEEVWSLPITQEMRETVKRDGIPLFARRQPQTAQQAQGLMQGFIARGQPLDRAMRIPFEIFGGVDRTGAWKPGEKLFKGASKIIAENKIDPNGRFGWMSGPIEAARAGLIDRYGLDPEYVERERRRALDERRILGEGAEILEGLKSAKIGTPEAKVLQAVLTGEAVGDADMQKIAAPIRVAIDRLGQEAVALGLVSAESYERNRATYLHRVYMKDEEGMNALDRFVTRAMTSRRKRIIGDQFKGRGIFVEVEQDRLVKNDPDWAEAKRGKPLKGERFLLLEYSPGSFVDAVSGQEREQRATRRVYWPADRALPARYNGPGWRERGTWEIRGEKGGKLVLWRDYTGAERRRMGEIIDARYTIGKTFMLMSHDLATGRLYKDIAENEQWTSTMEPSAPWKESGQFNRYWNDPEIQWVRVSDEVIAKTGGKKRWGALAGKWVRSEIWRDLNEIDIMSRPSTWRRLLTQWKLNKTARNPVVHMNNVMSNLMFMDMADVRFQDLAAGVTAFVRKDANYREALENGAFGADMMSQEIRDNVLRPILDDIRAEMLNSAPNAFVPRLRLLGRMAERIWGWAKKGDQFMLDAYRIEDEVFRMATYMRRRQFGDTPAQAAIFARDQFLDYDIRAPWVNALRNSVLPFVSYTYRATPLIARAIAHHPWKLPKYFIIAYMANALAYMWDDDEEAEGEERERMSMREDQQGYTWTGVPRMIRMPWRDENGLPVFLDIRRWIPAGDIFDLNQGQSAVPIPAPLQFGGPLMLGAELALNKQAFTGREITNSMTDDWWDTARNVGDWAWKSWMPSAAWVPNSWYWTRIENALTGATDTRGQPYSLPQAIASSVGIKIQPQDVEDGLSWRAWRFRQVEQELRRQARAFGRQRDRGLISEASYEREIARIMEKMRRLAEQARVPDRPTRDR